MNSPPLRSGRGKAAQALPHYVSTTLDEALAAFMADPAYLIRMAEDARRVAAKVEQKRLAKKR